MQLLIHNMTKKASNDTLHYKYSYPLDHGIQCCMLKYTHTCMHTSLPETDFPISFSCIAVLYLIRQLTHGQGCLYDFREAWQELFSPDTLRVVSGLLHQDPLCIIALFYPSSLQNTNRNHLDYRHVTRCTLSYFHGFFDCFLVMSPHFSLNRQLSFI